MAPTEILAEQHARGIGALVEPLGLEVTLLTGRLGAAERRSALEAIGKACEFESKPGTGVAFQIDIEDAIGLSGQIVSIKQEISKEDL